MFGQILGALAGGLLSDSGGGGSTTSKSEPWGPAQDWLKGNIALGQQLQNQYMANPISDQQKSAYSNAFGMSDAYRAMLPQLLSGMNQGQFDRRNPLQRPQAFNFSGFNPQMSQMGAFRSAMPQQTQTVAPASLQQMAAPVGYSEHGFADAPLGGFGDSDTWA